MNKKQDITLPLVLGFLCLILGIFVGGVAFSTQTQVEVPVLTEKIVYVNVTTPDFVLSQSDFEQNAEEVVSLQLALESVNSRDFKKAVFDSLVDYGMTIESYKDITNIKFEYDVDGDEVEFENIKVYFYIDGDEEETEKALLEDFTVEIDDLDYDNLEDAEVNEDFLDNLLVNKVY